MTVVQPQYDCCATSIGLLCSLNMTVVQPRTSCTSTKSCWPVKHGMQREWSTPYFLRDKKINSHEAIDSFEMWFNIRGVLCVLLAPNNCQSLQRTDISPLHSGGLSCQFQSHSWCHHQCRGFSHDWSVGEPLSIATTTLPPSLIDSQHQEYTHFPCAYFILARQVVERSRMPTRTMK